MYWELWEEIWPRAAVLLGFLLVAAWLRTPSAPALEGDSAVVEYSKKQKFLAKLGVASSLILTCMGFFREGNERILALGLGWLILLVSGCLYIEFNYSKIVFSREGFQRYELWKATRNISWRQVTRIGFSTGFSAYYFEIQGSPRVYVSKYYPSHRAFLRLAHELAALEGPPPKV